VIIIPTEVKDVPLFQGLSQSELNAVESCLREKSYAKGDILFSEGAGCERIFIVQSGRVKLFRTASSGREQILEILEAGETCACNPGNVVWFCNSTAEAQTPCTVWYLSRDNYIRMVQTNSKISRTLNELFAKRLQCFTSLIEEVSLKDVRKRLIKFLLDMHAKKKSSLNKNKDSLYIPFTHEEIAQRLGTARETVTRYLAQLKQAKLIELTPQHLTIKDKEGLEKLLR